MTYDYTKPATTADGREVKDLHLCPAVAGIRLIGGVIDGAPVYWRENGTHVDTTGTPKNVSRALRLINEPFSLTTPCPCTRDGREVRALGLHSVSDTKTWYMTGVLPDGDEARWHLEGTEVNGREELDLMVRSRAREAAADDTSVEDTTLRWLCSYKERAGYKDYLDLIYDLAMEGYAARKAATPLGKKVVLVETHYEVQPGVWLPHAVGTRIVGKPRRMFADRGDEATKEQWQYRSNGTWHNCDHGVANSLRRSDWTVRCLYYGDE